ncbi:MAG: hypothetical protein JWO53_295 [Chlamydiia bacterium]|nr:hypothetical protein [Chlamydiia bacterium]
MLDEEIKQLLVELQMTHYIEELEKVPIPTASLPIAVPLQVQSHSDEKEVKSAIDLRKHIQEVNQILVPQRQKRKKLMAVMVALLAIGGGGWYYNQMPEVAAEMAIVGPLQEIAQGSVQSEGLQKVLEERKIALKKISDEINALIGDHAEKKIDSFASQLTLLASKCQAVDEEYVIKIAAASQPKEIVETIAQQSP